MIKIIRLVVGVMKTNCYILYDDKINEAAIIDAGDDSDYIISTILKLNLKASFIISTHGHFDHNMAVYELKNLFNVPFFFSKKDYFILKYMPKSAKHYIGLSNVLVPNPDRFIKSGDLLKLGETVIKVINTPGHTPGGICLYIKKNKLLFSGDIIFNEGIGRYDFSYSDKNALIKSIKKIISIKNLKYIYPGHGNVIIYNYIKKILNIFT